MPKKETNSQSSNQEEILNKKETEEEHKQQVEKRSLSDIDNIREIALLIADSSYDGCYTLERYTESLYRFGFGIVGSGNVPIMFEGKTVNEAMYRAIDFELTLEIRLLSRERLTKLAEDRLATIQDEKQKRKGMEEEIATKDEEYKELMKERDELKQEREAISSIIDRVTDQWKDDEVMQFLKKDLASWRKRTPTLIAFLLENIEKLTHDAASYVAPPIEDLERWKEEHLLKEGTLAIVNKFRILESVWNDMQDKVLDGEWHPFSEVDEIIRTHGNRELTVESIRMKRGAYIRFAKDEKYHIARGEKSYLYERKTFRDGNKFRFTPVEEKVKPEKPVEKKEESLLKVEEHPLKREAIAAVNKIRILEPIWNDMQKVLDGKWHAFSEVDKIIRTHGYSKLTLKSIREKRSAYLRFAKDEKYHIERGEKDYLYKWKPIKGVNKFRFILLGELKLGKRICVIRKHSIFKKPYDEFERLFCDGKWHAFSDADEIFKKYEKYHQYKREGIRTTRNCYMTHAKKFYPMDRDGLFKFKFGKKFDKTDLAKIREGKVIKSPNSVKCARCGQAIQYGEECHQVDNLFYCLDCYKVIEA